MSGKKANPFYTTNPKVVSPVSNVTVASSLTSREAYTLVFDKLSDRFPCLAVNSVKSDYDQTKSNGVDPKDCPEMDSPNSTSTFTSRLRSREAYTHVFDKLSEKFPCLDIKSESDETETHGVDPRDCSELDLSKVTSRETYTLVFDRLSEKFPSLAVKSESDGTNTHGLDPMECSGLDPSNLTSTGTRHLTSREAYTLVFDKLSNKFPCLEVKSHINHTDTDNTYEGNCPRITSIPETQILKSRPPPGLDFSSLSNVQSNRLETEVPSVSGFVPTSKQQQQYRGTTQGDFMKTSSTKSSSSDRSLPNGLPQQHKSRRGATRELTLLKLWGKTK